MDGVSKRPSFLLRLSMPLLGLLCAAWAVNQWHLHTMQAGLQVLADEKLVEFQADTPEDPAHLTRMGAAVVVAKPFVFFGDPAGKVSVYVEETAPDGESHMEGFEYFFARDDNGDWIQTESGRCASEACTTEGKKLLDALGARF